MKCYEGQNVYMYVSCESAVHIESLQHFSFFFFFFLLKCIMHLTTFYKEINLAYIDLVFPPLGQIWPD